MSSVFILADNQAITRAGLHRLISRTVASAQVLEAESQQELFRLLEKHERAVVVLDYALFDFIGTEDYMTTHRRFPKVRWVLFSNELNEGVAHRASADDRISMVMKDDEGDEICMALRSAAAGERFLCRQITNLLQFRGGREAPASRLTGTEREILKLVAQGKSVKEIAEQRVSSIHTIVTHKKNIFRKLGVNSVHEATKYALRAGLVDFVEYYI